MLKFVLSVKKLEDTGTEASLGRRPEVGDDAVTDQVRISFLARHAVRGRVEQLVHGLLGHGLAVLLGEDEIVRRFQRSSPSAPTLQLPQGVCTCITRRKGWADAGTWADHTCVQLYTRPTQECAGVGG